MANLPGELHDLVPAISAWACERPRSVGFWFYGSRVKGTHHADSDLDIAVGVRAKLQTQEQKELFWSMLDSGNVGLSQVCGLRVSLQSDHTPGVDAGIAECGVLIYTATDD